MVRFALTVIRHGETRFNKEKILQGQGIDEPLSETGLKQAVAAGGFLTNVTFTHAFSSDLTRTKQTMCGILEKSKFCKDLTVKYDSRLRERSPGLGRGRSHFQFRGDRIIKSLKETKLVPGKYGVAEGKPLSELRAMAKAAGEECPMFTPPGGETLAQVKMRGKDFFEFLCRLVLEEAGQKEQFSPGTRSTSLETCLTEVFALGKSSNSEFNAGGGGPGLAASVLVVSHGAFMRNLFDYFLTDLRCSLPAALSKFELTSVSPNTGISLFVIHLEEGRQPVIQCVCMNLREHLNRVTEAH